MEKTYQKDGKKDGFSRFSKKEIERKQKITEGLHSWTPVIRF